MATWPRDLDVEGEDVECGENGVDRRLSRRSPLLVREFYADAVIAAIAMILRFRADQHPRRASIRALRRAAFAAKTVASS